MQARGGGNLGGGKREVEPQSPGMVVISMRRRSLVPLLPVSLNEISRRPTHWRRRRSRSSRSPQTPCIKVHAPQQVLERGKQGCLEPREPLFNGDTEPVVKGVGRADAAVRRQDHASAKARCPLGVIVSFS